MQVGDLVCYNAAGQKYKSMALVVGLDNRSKNNPFYEHDCVQLMWVLLPEIGPGIQRTPHDNGWVGGSFSTFFRGNSDMLRANENIVLWHPIGDWFEVIQCK